MMNIYFQSTELMYSPYNLPNFTLKCPVYTFNKQSCSLFSPSHGTFPIFPKHLRIRAVLRVRSKPILDLSVHQAYPF